MALVIGAFLAVISIGIMLAALFGYWPPKSSGEAPAAGPTPHVPQAVGVMVEKVGEPQRAGDTVTVTLKVTNKVKMSAPMTGTQVTSAATPTAGPTDLYNASIKVVFYRMDGDKKNVVGSGLGNVTDLPYNASKQTVVVCTPVGAFTEYEAYADTVTNKEAIKPETSGAENGQEAPATPSP